MAKTRRRQFSEVPLPPEAWSTLVAVAEQAGLAPRGGAPLATAVQVASRLYTGQREAIPGHAADPDMLAARLLFYLVRDFAKVVAPLDELWRLGFRPAGQALRVLDLGAGVGASTLGTLRFAALQGLPTVEVTAVDTQGAALEVARRALAALATPPWAATAKLQTRVASAGDRGALAGGPWDVVVASFVLNEMLLAVPETERPEAGAAILERWGSALAPGGALVVLEPALKGESRTLSAVRDALLARKGPGELSLAAPCLHDAGCPMLEADRDWCHQELPLALPAPFDGLARAAGLRWEGLSFSYLSLVRRGGAWEPGGDAPAGHARRLRVVSEALVSKGKRELLGCGDGELVRVTRLDRSDSEANEDFERLERGDVFELEGAEPKGRGLRVEADTRVTRTGRGIGR